MRRPGAVHRSTPPQIIGHRGAPREHVENTLPAFQRALELGAEALELDVHSTADGVPVVHHDPVLDDGGPRIATLTLEALQNEVQRAETQVPTLAAVLDLVGDRADLYVELKGRAIEREVISVVRASPGAGARCALHAFDHRATAAARALDRSLPGGVLLVSYLVDTRSALRAADARDLWMWWEMIDLELVEVVHGVGGRVIAWTVNSAEATTTLARLGVDGICTDDIPLVRAALKAISSP